MNLPAEINKNSLLKSAFVTVFIAMLSAGLLHLIIPGESVDQQFLELYSIVPFIKVCFSGALGLYAGKYVYHSFESKKSETAKWNNWK